MSDKRTVATDAGDTLGTILDDTAKRDAIHLAVEPVIAGEGLSPANHVNVKDGVATLAAFGEGMGIVDPFLTTYINKGQRFWFVLYPRQITSLRHIWTHPAFPEQTDARPMTEQEASKRWISDFSNKVQLHYKTLMDGARNYLEYDDYLSFGGLLEGVSVPDEFWTHYRIVTGENVPENKVGNFFSCSC